MRHVVEAPGESFHLVGHAVETFILALVANHLPVEPLRYDIESAFHRGAQERHVFTEGRDLVLRRGGLQLIQYALEHVLEQCEIGLGHIVYGSYSTARCPLWRGAVNP